MDEIIKLSENISTNINIEEKIKMVNTLNDMIKTERTNLNYLLENKLVNLKVKIPLKYKKMSIEELEIEFNNSNNINDKISIYYALDKAYNNICSELFN